MFEIKEVWIVCGERETEERTCKDLSEVGEYIRGWIDGWLDSALENEYEVKSVRTDFKKSATISIKTGEYNTDRFNLKVKQSEDLHD